MNPRHPLSAFAAVLALLFTGCGPKIENAASADQAQFLPGDGRGLFTGLEYRW